MNLVASTPVLCILRMRPLFFARAPFPSLQLRMLLSHACELLFSTFADRFQTQTRTYATKKVTPVWLTFGTTKDKPREFWTKRENALHFLEWFRHQNSAMITTISCTVSPATEMTSHRDWYGVSLGHFDSMGGKMLRRQFIGNRKVQRGTISSIQTA